MIAALSVFAAYVVSSAVLFRKPSLVHPTLRRSYRVLHISHRGGALERPENTIGAFSHALSQGTDMIEIDVRLSRDGKV